MRKNENFNSDHITIIKPQKGWQFIDLKEIYVYKDLLRFLVIRGVKAKYAQSILGIGWAVIQPLFTTILITFVFGNLAGMDTFGINGPVFFAAAVVPWTYFSNCITESSNSLVVNANIITKVYFPRLIIPISPIFSKLLDLSISMLVLFLFCLWQGCYPNIYYLFIPILILLMAMTAAGMGMILSAMSIQYRDINYAMSFMMQLLIYTVPVAYSTDKIPDSFKDIYAINPMVGIIESFRFIFAGPGQAPYTSMPYNYLIIGSISAIVVLVFGAFYFKRMERVFADVA